MLKVLKILKELTHITGKCCQYSLNLLRSLKIPEAENFSIIQVLIKQELKSHHSQNFTNELLMPSITQLLRKNSVIMQYFTGKEDSRLFTETRKTSSHLKLKSQIAAVFHHVDQGGMVD